MLTACTCLLWQAVASAVGEQEQGGAATATVKQPMPMDEPMDSGMMKKGMKKGDVKKSAERHKEEMDKMLKKEEASMPPMPEHMPKTAAPPQR